MEPIRITSGPPTIIKKWKHINQFNQFSKMIGLIPYFRFIKKKQQPQKK